MHSPLRLLSDESLAPKPIAIGEGYCETPFTTGRLVIISAMSFGSILKPAVRALSYGAKDRAVGLPETVICLRIAVTTHFKLVL